MVKENLHSRSFQSTPNCMLKYGARLLGGDAREPFDKFVKRCVVFKVLKRAETGTRVARKTQAPLTRTGFLSTAGQDDQSIIARE